ncbi:restriction endonuclease subunit S [Francisella marina]|uniref:Type I restriction modification DNA specificity domain-containing protein n=1 Tax=Francisella marina TaxID=2249302 RepID=A0ABX5ZG96_9GAMM|nr:restriction endonuclease subunit S [Francisella marina]QEO57071.1 hypothetical protein F0R74_04085 [Francisella marina]QEO58813.1 hypothetical protein F0R75_03145 [Francisella marina]
MAEYKLDSSVDNNKIFLVNYSELQNRWDPAFNSYIQNLLHNFSCQVVKFKDLLKVNPQYGANEAGIERTTEEQAKYVRITDIDEFGNLIPGLGKTANKIESRFLLNENDILIARSGNTVGKSYIHEKVREQSLFAGYMIRFVIDTFKAVPKYIFIYTQTTLYKEWVKNVQRSSGQPNINAEEYKSLLIPLPNLEIQNQIIQKYEQAYQQKQQKEQKARELLASIDSYLLDKLGIELPEKDNSLQARIFTTDFSEVSGSRWDCDYHQTYYKKFETNLFNDKYNITSLKEVISFLESGSRPKGGVSSIKEGVFSIGGEHVNSQCQVYEGKPKYIPLEFHKKILKTETKINDIILVKDGATTGKVGLLENIGFVGQNINEHVFLIRTLKEKINPTYLAFYLYSSIGQIFLKREITGATVTGLTKESVKGIKIPLPPLTPAKAKAGEISQQEIVEHISAIRAKAKRLQEEAIADLETTKAEIEKMILGD